MGYGSGTRRVLGVALCLGALAAVASPIGSAALPAPEELVPNTIVRIDEAASRDDETITRAELRHGVALAAEGIRPVPRPGEKRYEPLERAALAGLIEPVWIRGQAAEMEIVVTRDQVRSQLAKVKRETFTTGADFRTFLKGTPFTRRDIYERVELQLLVARLQRRVVAGVKSEAEKQKAFSEFLDEFNERWRARTVCAPEHVTVRCSNGPPPPS
jgi:hypothetical protein